MGGNREIDVIGFAINRVTVRIQIRYTSVFIFLFLIQTRYNLVRSVGLWFIWLCICT